MRAVRQRHLAVKYRLLVWQVTDGSPHGKSQVARSAGGGAASGAVSGPVPPHVGHYTVAPCSVQSSTRRPRLKVVCQA